MMRFPGMTWGDSLDLTPEHVAALIFNTASLLLWRDLSTQGVIFPALLGFMMVAVAFWRDLPAIDSFLLMRECSDLGHLSWRRFTRIYYRHPYLKYQTPFVPFLIAKLSTHYITLWILWDLFAACNIVLLCVVFHSSTFWILACPLFAMMLCQPSTDLPMIFFILLTFVCMQQHLFFVAAFMFALGVAIKPIALSLLPFLFLSSPAFIMSVLFLGVGGYFSKNEEWFVILKDFLLHQCYLVCRESDRNIAAGNRETHGGQPIGWRRWVVQSFMWRLKTVSCPALSVLPIYVCPIVLGFYSWQWPGLVLAGIIFVMYGNVKYYSLAILLLFMGRLV